MRAYKFCIDFGFVGVPIGMICVHVCDVAISIKLDFIPFIELGRFTNLNRIYYADFREIK